MSNFIKKIKEINWNDIKNLEMIKNNRLTLDVDQLKAAENDDVAKALALLACLTQAGEDTNLDGFPNAEFRLVLSSITCFCVEDGKVYFRQTPIKFFNKICEALEKNIKFCKKSDEVPILKTLSEKNYGVTTQGIVGNTKKDFDDLIKEMYNLFQMRLLRSNAHFARKKLAGDAKKPAPPTGTSGKQNGEEEIIKLLNRGPGFDDYLPEKESVTEKISKFGTSIHEYSKRLGKGVAQSANKIRNIPHKLSKSVERGSSDGKTVSKTPKNSGKDKNKIFRSTKSTFPEATDKKVVKLAPSHGKNIFGKPTFRVFDKVRYHAAEKLDSQTKPDKNDYFRELDESATLKGSQVRLFKDFNERYVKKWLEVGKVPGENITNIFTNEQTEKFGELQKSLKEIFKHLDGVNNKTLLQKFINLFYDRIEDFRNKAAKIDAKKFGRATGLYTITHANEAFYTYFNHMYNSLKQQKIKAQTVSKTMENFDGKFIPKEKGEYDIEVEWRMVEREEFETWLSGYTGLTSSMIELDKYFSGSRFKDEEMDADFKLMSSDLHRYEDDVPFPFERVQRGVNKLKDLIGPVLTPLNKSSENFKKLALPESSSMYKSIRAFMNEASHYYKTPDKRKNEHG